MRLLEKSGSGSETSRQAIGNNTINDTLIVKNKNHHSNNDIKAIEVLIVMELVVVA